MAAIDQKIDVYKWNKEHYDEESIYSTQTGALIEGLQNFYGNGYAAAFEIEFKFQISPLSACEAIKDTNNRLSFGTVKSGNNYYWQLKYYNGSSLITYVSSFTADVDKHVFKLTKEGNYYLDSTLLVSARYSSMSTGTISIFNSGICKVFSVIYPRFNRTSTSGGVDVYETNPSSYTYYYPFKNIAGTCGLKQTLSNSSYVGYKWNTGTGTLSGDFNSESLDFAVELTNENFESVKSVEALSVLGDELVYDTLEVIAKEKPSFSANVKNIVFNGSSYAEVSNGASSIGTNMEFSVIFTLHDLKTPMQGIIAVSFDFIISYAGEANENKFIVYYVDENSATHSYLLPIVGDYDEHTFSYANGVLKYDNETVVNNITIKSGETSFTYTYIGHGLLSTAEFEKHDLIGKIREFEFSGVGGNYAYVATPDKYEDEYCFNKVGSFHEYAKSETDVPFEAELDGEVEIFFSDDLENFPYGSVANHYIGDVLKSKFYFEESKRLGIRKYQYNCFSAIGLLDRQYYTGNLFHGENFLLVVNEILAGSGLTYSVDSDLTDIAIYGWIPYGTKRDALRQLLFATNAHVFKDSNKNIVFKYLDVSEILEIPGNKVFDNGSVEYPKLATKVTITEHSYYSLGTEETIVLFDNTQGVAANKQLVKFESAPIILSSFATSGTLTVESASVNHAVVSGQGKLTGKAYTHVTQDITRNAQARDRENYEVTVTDATLVSAVNSENVADRVADYYFNRFVAKADIKVENESCGIPYSFTNAFNEECVGILARMEKVFSSFVRAACEFICGLSETGGGGNNYTNYALITSSGTWTVPAGINKLRLTMIGGGNGGSSGLRGDSADGRSGGAGGAAGIPGNAGKVYIVTIDVEPGDELTINIGSGGSGGAACSSTSSVNEGNAGTSSSVLYDGKTYSSGSGVSPTRGVVNIFTDDVYALPGNSGVSGGRGGNGGNGGNNSGNDGNPGEGVVFNGASHSGGQGGTQVGINSYAGNRYIAGGGGGSGASAASNGSTGSNGSAQQTYYDEESIPGGIVIEAGYETIGGAGATGASGGSRSAATLYGSGGDAGHGGGGAGGRGSGVSYDYSTGYEVMIHEWCHDSTPETNAVGGNGGAGGAGAQGCILIYY